MDCTGIGVFRACVRITDSQREKLRLGSEELETLADLLERILQENSDSATGTELRDVGILLDLVNRISPRAKSSAPAKTTNLMDEKVELS